MEKITLGTTIECLSRLDESIRPLNALHADACRVASEMIRTLSQELVCEPSICCTNDDITHVVSDLIAYSAIGLKLSRHD